MFGKLASELVSKSELACNQLLSLPPSFSFSLYLALCSIVQ